MAEFDLGTIGISDSVMMAGDTSFELDIQGKGGHGAMPQYANNPINYIQKVIEEIDNIARINDAIITPTVVNGGSSYNVIPDRIYQRYMSFSY